MGKTAKDRALTALRLLQMYTTTFRNVISHNGITVPTGVEDVLADAHNAIDELSQLCPACRAAVAYANAETALEEHETRPTQPLTDWQATLVILSVARRERREEYQRTQHAEGCPNA